MSQAHFSAGPYSQLEKEMVTHSSILAWEIPQTEEPGRLQSMGLQRVGHDLVTNKSNKTNLQSYLNFYLVIVYFKSTYIALVKTCH